MPPCVPQQCNAAMIVVPTKRALKMYPLVSQKFITAGSYGPSYNSPAESSKDNSCDELVALLFPQAWVVAVFTGERPERGETSDPKNHGESLNDENSPLIGGFGEYDGDNNEVGEGEECPYGKNEGNWNFDHLVRGVPVVRGGYGMSARFRWLLNKMLDPPSAIKAMTICANSTWAPRTGRRRVWLKTCLRGPRLPRDVNFRESL